MKTKYLLTFAVAMQAMVGMAQTDVDVTPTKFNIQEYNLPEGTNFFDRQVNNSNPDYFPTDQQVQKQGYAIITGPAPREADPKIPGDNLAFYQQLNTTSGRIVTVNNNVKALVIQGKNGNWYDGQSKLTASYNRFWGMNFIIPDEYRPTTNSPLRIRIVFQARNSSGSSATISVQPKHKELPGFAEASKVSFPVVTDNNQWCIYEYDWQGSQAGSTSNSLWLNIGIPGGTWIDNSAIAIREIKFIKNPTGTATVAQNSLTATRSYDSNNPAPILLPANNATINMSRPMVAGTWNAVCFPFSMNDYQITQKFGADAQIAEFSSVNDNQLNFTTLATRNMEAGKPYLVKLGASKETLSSFQLWQSGVIPEGITPQSVTPSGSAYSFKGCFVPTQVADGTYYFSTDPAHPNTIYKVASPNNTIKAYRAYLEPVSSSAAASSKGVTFTVDGVTTSISGLTKTAADDDAVYNMAGQRVSKDYKGIVIKNGKKVVQ